MGKVVAKKNRMMTLKKVRDLVISIANKTTNIYGVVRNNKRLKIASGSESSGFDKLYEDTYEYVLMQKIEYGSFSYEAYYDKNIKIHLVRLVDFMVQAIEVCAYVMPDLMIPVRTPMLIENIKKLRLPKYMIYSIIILGSQILPSSRIPKALNTKRLERMLTFVRKTLDNKSNKPRMNHIWCRHALVEHKNCNRFNHVAQTDLLKSFNACIILGLHKVDTDAKLNTQRFKLGKNEMEFRRRIFWMVYLNNSAIFGFSKLIFNGVLYKSANKLPQRDYEWRNGIEYKEPTQLFLVQNGELIKSKESRRINADITKIRCMVFAVHNRICSLRNQRCSLIRKNYQLDFKKYKETSKLASDSLKKLKKYTLDTLQTLQLYENANFLIIDEASVKNLLFQLWYLFVVLINASTMLCLTEIAHLTYFVNEPWRVQMAKMLCIDHALNGVKILKWGYNKISIAYMDLNLYISVYWIMSALINASYITDLPNHSQVVEGLEFVFQFLSKIEPKFMNRGMAVDSFKRAINVKEYYHGINTKSNMIPTILANASLTATDINPWFIMGTPASVGYTCCHLANPITAFRTLSLNHYVDFPVISLTPTDCDHLIQVSASFSLFTEYIDKCFINTTPERYLLIKNKKFNDFDKIPEVNQQNNLNRIQVSNLVYRSFKYYSWSREDANTFITSFLNLVFSSS